METRKNSKVKKRMVNYDTDEEKKTKRNKVDKERVNTPEKKVAGQINNVNSDNWVKIDTVLVRDFDSIPSEKILGFDLDDTLISPKGSNKFATNENDWQILHEQKLKEVLKKYEDFKIVIFTNQKGISKGHTDSAMWKKKVEKIQEYLKLPFLVIAATEDDYYRKPCIGMWELVAKYNNDITPDPEKSIYVGDAAGRVRAKGKKDHSDSDYKFALNVGCKFYTPEEFNEIIKKDTIPSITFDPNVYEKNEKDETIFTSKNQEIIIFVGSAGSGKTSFYKRALSNYVHINQDQLKTVPKCVKAASDAIDKGNSVVIDSTNASAKARSTFIELAKEKKIPIRCFYFKYDKDLVFHINNLRNINKYRKHNTKAVADVIIHTWFKNLEEPNVKEGFAEVKVIPFIPNFESENDRKVFYMYS
jgi:bifunctional polynucleotide phosphatase/kinase